ncbi:hypothetical protein I4U23_000829 [Adineta vaga]|nr:hypothetical protein I4U23_000829 [Adineta vaga]
MVDRDGKKPFIIPKTHTSDVLVFEKPESRNVKELFHDMKSCALEVHFDFRPNECKSCDTIRNSKLQKSFNERKLEMKKSQDQIERFAFHLVSSRDIAMNIANDGLSCEQLTFPIDKYLGNPKDGIHLSRRPDVLLASTGLQNLHKFGLLICKILVGKGYPTVPATNNKGLSAQLHYDHHFCKIQTLNKDQRNINDLLADSLIFCYEHKDMQTVSHPSQILPLAILWYDLTEKFSTELTPSLKELQQRNPKPLQPINSYKMKQTIKPVSKSILPLNTGTWDEPIQELSTKIINETTPTKYPSQFMVPYTSQQLTTTYMTRTVISVETIPLSPLEKSSSTKQPSIEKVIPFNSTNQLVDPRLKTRKQTHNVFYLENKAIKHALQQQKRLNNYCNTKNELLTKKTSFTLIPFEIHSISLNEYECQRQNSSLKDYSSLSISVVDCFQMGLKRSEKQLYIDLEDNINQSAYKQIQISNQLIEQEKQLNSQERRLHLREQRQRKFQEHLNERKKYELPNSTFYVNNGRKLLKEHQIISSVNHQLSPELLDFFSHEYRQENRPQVKRILAELLGIFVEKYGLQSKQTVLNDAQVRATNTFISMDIESSSTQILNDHDERFPIQIPSQYLSESNQENGQFLITNNTITNSDERIDVDLKTISEQSRDDVSKSPSPSHRQPFDNNGKENEDQMNTNKTLPSTRTVTLVSNDHADNLIIKTTNTYQEPKNEENEDEEEKQQPIVKRIKVDLISPLMEDIDVRQVITKDRDERRITISSRSRSQSNSSHNSPIKEFRTRPSSPSSKRNSYQRERRRNDYDYERNRSYDRSYHNQSRKNNSTTISSRHQKFNYNHQSVAEHPRFANIDKIPSLLDSFNHEFIGMSNNSDYQQSSMTNINRNPMSSCYNERSSNQPYYQDNYINNFIQPSPQPLMSTIPGFPNLSDSKPSETIEQLQMFLQHRTNTRNDLQSSSSYTINSHQDRNNTQWPSSRYSSNTDNQTFSYNDAEQLLTLVQRFRN